MKDLKNRIYIWSRNWDEFDFSEIEEKVKENPECLIGKDIKEIEEYIGLSKEEFTEYVRWVSLNRPDIKLRLIMDILRNNGNGAS